MTPIVVLVDMHDEVEANAELFPAWWLPYYRDRLTVIKHFLTHSKLPVHEALAYGTRNRQLAKTPMSVLSETAAEPAFVCGLSLTQCVLNKMQGIAKRGGHVQCVENCTIQGPKRRYAKPLQSLSELHAFVASFKVEVDLPCVYWDVDKKELKEAV